MSTISLDLTFYKLCRLWFSGECTDKPIDLVFLLDSSWSLRSEANFMKELKFVSDVVTVLNWNKARVSILTFSDSAEVRIPFGAYNNLREFQDAVSKIPWKGGNTYTDVGLDLMMKEIRSNQFGGRSGVMTMGVVITDGGSTNPYSTQEAIARVHSAGVEMFAIGKTFHCYINFLQALTTNIKAMGSSPTLGKDFSFIFRFPRAPRRSTELSYKRKSSITFIRV